MSEMLKELFDLLQEHKLSAVLKQAVERVPAVRFAYGAAGIAAAGGLITLFLGRGRSAVIVWLCTFVAMVLLLAFSSVATRRNASLQFAGRVLVYAVTVVFCLFLILTATAFMNLGPESWARFLGVPTPSATRSFSEMGSVVNFGCEAGATSPVTFKAPPGYRIVNANVQAINVVAAKQVAPSAVANDGHTASAQIYFHGRDRDWVHNCPGGGHGQAKIIGDYAPEPLTLAIYLPIAVVFILGALVGLLAILFIRPRELGMRPGHSSVSQS